MAYAAVPAGGLGLAQGKGRAGFQSPQDGGWDGWENFSQKFSEAELPVTTDWFALD